MAKKAKYLVIVESPAKAKTINKILKSDYIVKASYGHVRDLPNSGLNIDLETFDARYEVIADKRKIVSELKKIAQESEKVFLCPDPDREGEAIAFHLSVLLGVPEARMRRVTFNEITSSAITEAFKHPRDIDMNLVNSQQTRRLLDRLVGYKVTNVLWEKILRGLSAGRVQSVAVRLLAEREAEIRAFKPQEYWTIGADFQSKQKFDAELKEIKGQALACSAKDLEKSRLVLSNEKEARAAATRAAKPDEYVVLEYSKKESSEPAYPPFKTSTLQQAAANRLGFDASRTMRVAQQLYEGIQMGAESKGLITYMRTDSFNVSKEAQETARRVIVARWGQKYYPTRPNYYRGKKGAQEAHECIRPTYPEITPQTASQYLSGEQARMYDLIWRRFMASQMVPAIFDVSNCSIGQSGGDKAVFRATGKVLTFDGWTAVYERDESQDKVLPDLVVGQKLKIGDVRPTQHFTEPPPRYNDASLVKKLEAEGIGRPSTYASIIKTVIDRKYVQRMGQGGRAPLGATELGMLVTESMKGFFSIMELGFTKQMEEMLDGVEEGTTDYKKLLADFWKDLQKEIKRAKAEMPSAKEGKPSDHPCPKCATMMMSRMSRFGPFYQCPKEGCGHTMDGGEDGPKEKQNSHPTGLKCDKCGADVVLNNGRFGSFLSCSRYNEKTEVKEGKKKRKVPACNFTMNLSKKGEPRRKLEPTATDISCDKCNKNKMVIRVATRKKDPGAFLSCSGFPRCRHAVPLPDELEKEGEALLGEYRKNRQKDIHDMPVFRKFIEENGIEL